MTMKQSAPAKGARLADPAKFTLFMVVGGFAALVNLVSRYLLTPVVGFGSSVVIAYLIGMLVAFVLFRGLVFQSSGRDVSDEVWRFVIVNIGALTLVWAISLGLARVIFPALHFHWHADDVAHFVGTGVPAISSYNGHSIYTFRIR
jgi:putative flippase GtrA